YFLLCSRISASSVTELRYERLQYRAREPGKRAGAVLDLRESTGSRGSHKPTAPGDEGEHRRKGDYQTSPAQNRGDLLGIFRGGGEAPSSSRILRREQGAVPRRAGVR